MRHVRDLIQFLDHDSLRAKGVIPNVIFTNLLENQKSYKSKYPVWVINQRSFCAYGMFMDMLMKEMLSNKNWKDKVFEISQQAYEIYDFFPPTKEEVYQRFGTYTNVYKWLISNLPGNSKEIILEPEVNFERITGHPDLVINTKDRLFVLDIKTTVNFERMEKETILQLLSYLALLKATGQAKQKIHTIGVVLPFERKIIVYDVKNFDVKFLKELSPKNEVSNSNVILSF